MECDLFYGGEGGKLNGNGFEELSMEQNHSIESIAEVGVTCE